MLTFADRADIAVGIESGLSDTEIADKIDRDRTVVGRERRRTATKTRGYPPMRADCGAAIRRRRPQQFRIDSDPVLTARVQADMPRSRTPRQLAGRLRLEARDTNVDPMAHSTDANGRTVSHEAIFRWIYALPEGDLAKSAMRTQRKKRKPLGQRRGGRIIPPVGYWAVVLRHMACPNE